jgi:hypothetical protein
VEFGGDHAEHLVLDFGRAANALKQSGRHDQRVRKNAELGEFQLASGDIGGEVETGDVGLGVGSASASARDGSEAVGSVGERGDAGLVADLNLVQQHVSHSNLDIEEAGEIALRGVGKNLFQAELGGRESIADKLAGHAGIGGTGGDLGRVVVQRLALAEIDLEIFARANIGNIDRHDFRADEKVLAVAAAFKDGLCDVAPDCGGESAMMVGSV